MNGFVSVVLIELFPIYFINDSNVLYPISASICGCLHGNKSAAITVSNPLQTISTTFWNLATGICSDIARRQLVKAWLTVGVPVHPKGVKWR